jgi:hypothetical protein
MKNKEQIIEIAIPIMFGIAVIVALIMSWFSMTDLATTTFGLPNWISWIISLAFDIGAIFLALITVSAALKGESATIAKLSTLAFIGTSLYINVYHAGVADYGIAGMIMFGAAPAIVFIAFEIYLRHILKRELREQGLIPDRMPKVGTLTWLRHRKEAFALFSKALNARLIKEDKILDAKLETYGILPTVEQAPIKVEASVEAPQKPAKPAIKSKPKELLPAMNEAEKTTEFAEVTAKESIPFGFTMPKPEFTATTVRGQAIEAYHMGHQDNKVVAQWLDTDTATISKHFYAAKQQLKK